jgi:hypothetical protein
MKRTVSMPVFAALVLFAGTLMHRPADSAPLADDWTVIGWNDLGMHCMDSDYAVFSILPPFNTVIAQVVDAGGNLIENPAGVTVTYRAIADPSGSINRTSVGKTNFWDRVLELYGASLGIDEGLAGNDMPGPANAQQPMHFDAAHSWFIAEGIPIAPVDDAGNPQNYPLMRLEVYDASGVLRGSSDVVLPISDEMDCRVCHASGAGPDARPAAGWENSRDYERDYRLNILRLHDERQGGNPRYQAALASFGFEASGLYDTVVQADRSILCSACHRSNALPGTGFGGISSLTQAVHLGHANVIDPINGMTLESSANRASCYRCHPGSETRCLRGAMGSAVASDGTLEMQCQGCHGSMSTVGDPAREGWFEEPNCQSCHTGTATHNNGQIRYTSSFEPDGSERVAVNQTFATDPDTPAVGLDLYRFSDGHGGLQCSACHGSTHAIFPSSHENDNLQNIALQGHAGTLTDCDACHQDSPETTTGGPHGMHRIGQEWISDHPDIVEHQGAQQCRLCHGTDYRGTVLSRSQGDRVISTKFGQKNFWEGYRIGCYDCHDGPDDDDNNPNNPPTVQDASASTPAGVPVAVDLVAADSDSGSVTVRIVSQPHNGTVALSGTQATYYPFTGFAGSDSFTFAAWDGESESQLGEVSLTVTANQMNFGDGHPGTNGVPELTAGAVPSLGTGVPVHFGNSAGVATVGFIITGDRSIYQPTPWGGVRLVNSPSFEAAVQLPPGGLDRIISIPSNPARIGENRLMQFLVRDTGASHGLAFSRGLRLTIGL